MDTESQTDTRRVEQPPENTRGPGTRKRTARACDRCSSHRVRCDGRTPCNRCREYERGCFYTRTVGKRGRRPHSSFQKTLQHSTYDSPSPDSPEHAGLQDESCAESITDKNNEPWTVQRDIYTGLQNVPTSSPLALTPSISPETFTSVLVSTGSHELDIPAALISGQSREVPAHIINDASYSAPSVVTETPVRHGRQLASSMDCSAHPRSDEHRTSRFRCLEPVLPMLHGIIDEDLACKLLESYFREPGRSLFECASPYVLTHVLRKNSLLRPDSPRRTTCALLVTILWVASQTADDDSFFLAPGRKATVCEGLRKLMLSLIQERDQDSWDRDAAGMYVRDHMSDRGATENVDSVGATISQEGPPVPSVDDVLTFLLLTIVVSGGDFKADCFRWLHKALRLSRTMGLNREDSFANTSISCCTGGTTCACRSCDASRSRISVPEVQEERRRVFWLLFCLDRHLALSLNSPLHILDHDCVVYRPVPDDEWEAFDPASSPVFQASGRVIGPPTTVSGTSFFDYFLPLMTILGDVIHLHRRRCHPRFTGTRLNNELDADTALVESVLAKCERSIDDLAHLYGVDELLDNASAPASDDQTVSQEFPPGAPPLTSLPRHSVSSMPSDMMRSQSCSTANGAQARLVTVYSKFILHVLHVLLHGKWDPVSMLENDDGWVSSPGFVKCASHSIAASEAVSQILARDPELAFMPYLFGIYLLHGSFILLLFADRMPQIGLNESVERACEIIIRAHEVCVVTLSTQFQIRFRKVLRSTLYSVRSAGKPPTAEESASRLRALSVYRWSGGFTGLAA
ncbi:transcriptional activator xlnR [Pestalotiopsis sp. NC0098]|nr:transcriptional activator xlnR [Pestalotiopsis sp. NC0098]